MFNQQFQNFNQLLAHNYNSWHCNHHHNTFPSTLFAHHAHDFLFCSIYCYSYCVLCIFLQCSNILQLQYVFFVVGYTHHHLSHDFTCSSSSSASLVCFFDYWKLHGARRTLGNVALILMRVLLLLWPHRSIDLECYQLFACLLFCECARVTIVWARGFDY